MNTDFYSTKYSDHEWINQRIEDAKYLIKQIKAYKIFSKGKYLLDVGCGSGDFAYEIKKEYNMYSYGIDLNRIGIKRALKNGVIAKVVNIDKKWPFKKNSFDVITALEIIEHVTDPDNLIKESSRLLKKDGILVIQTPNLACWLNRIILMFGYQPFFAEVSTKDKTIGLKFTQKLTQNRSPVGHLRCFTLKALIDLLELYNFKIIGIKGNQVYYLPKYLYLFDYFFSKIPTLATDITVIAIKSSK